MLQRRDLIAAGIGVVAAVTFAALWRSGPADPAAPTTIATTSSAMKDAAAPAPPPAPTPAPAPAPVPADDPIPAGDALADDPVNDPLVHARWQERLAREDEELVRQAVAAGCDPRRAEQMRAVLATKREERARTIEEYRAGRISNAEMTARARTTKRKADDALRALLTPTELAALDPDGARAAVIEAEKDRP